MENGPDLISEAVLSSLFSTVEGKSSYQLKCQVGGRSAERRYSRGPLRGGEGG